MEEYLTLKEVGALLRVSEQTIRNWIKQRKLPVFRMGRTVRVPRRAIETYVQYCPSPSDQSVAQNRQEVFERLHKLRQQLAECPGVLSDILLDSRPC